MPRGLQFLLLLLAVPLQYLICQWTAPSAGERAQLIKQISKSLTIFSGGVLEWQKWPEMVANWTRSLMLLLDDEDGECPAEEVIKFQEKNGQFGMSTVPRTPRPKHVKFHVGQVIRHKLWNYRGIIIGWDEKLKASQDWTQTNHGDKKHWREMPNYAILVDIRDRPSSQITYVPEENIEVITNTKTFAGVCDGKASETFYAFKKRGERGNAFKVANNRGKLGHLQIELVQGPLWPLHENITVLFTRFLRNTSRNLMERVTYRDLG